MEKYNNENTELLDDDWDFNFQKEVIWRELIWTGSVTFGYLIFTCIIFLFLIFLYDSELETGITEEFQRLWNLKITWFGASIPLIAFHYFAIKNHWKKNQYLDVKWRLISFLIYLISWILILILFFPKI